MLMTVIIAIDSTPLFSESSGSVKLNSVIFPFFLLSKETAQHLNLNKIPYFIHCSKKIIYEIQYHFQIQDH